MSRAGKYRDIEQYIVRPAGRRKEVNWRDYVIPTKRKGKRRISEQVDKIVYGV